MDSTNDRPWCACSGFIINWCQYRCFKQNILKLQSHRTMTDPCLPLNTRTYLQWKFHYNDVIMSTIASQITSLTIVYSTVYSGADQRKHQSSASLAFVRGIHRGPVNSPHKGTVTRKMFPFDDVIMQWIKRFRINHQVCFKNPSNHLKK